MDSMKERLVALLGIEQLVLLSLLSVGVFILYKLFLRKINADRHQNLNKLFSELFVSYIFYALMWIAQWMILKQWHVIERVYNYVAIAAVVMAAVVFVRAIKILVFEYLFLKSMTAGVPVLLVNLVTLMISIFIAAWLCTSVFGVRLAPLLATSAILSVVLGLALQDTLGNLFAGVALQFDKPYEIGDWIEVNTGDTSFVGEVHEITWRATTLWGVYDEVITLPNRLTAQSEVSNYSARKKPVYRGLTVVLDAHADEERIKKIFIQVLKEARGVLQNVQHYVMLRDLSEKGSHWRLFYPIVHFSQQYFIVDDILMRAQAALKKEGIEISRLRVDTEGHSPNRS